MIFPKKFIHISLLFFAITALSGIWMRLFYASQSVQVTEYTHILHGHSHMATLGWTFIAVFILFLAMIWQELPNKKHAKAILWTTFIVTVIMFFAFLYQGYALYSIILSTIHIFIEYWMIIFIIITTRKMTSIPQISKLFFYAACFFLFVSSIGPFSLGAIASQGLRDNPLFEIAIYFYLHFQYNGWLYLMLIGLFLFYLTKIQIHVNEKLIKLSFWLYFFSLFPAVFLSLLWYEVGTVGYIGAWIGAVGQFISIIILFIALLQHVKPFIASVSQHMAISYLFVFIMLFGKHLMEFGLLYLPFAEVIYDTRSVVVGYLHLLLLGFISMFIFNLYQSTELLSEAKKRVTFGIAIFLAGFMLNEGLLFIAGLFAWLNMKVFAFQNEGLLLATILLFIGILTVWSSLFWTKKKS
ncbi:MAG TPA: hypothetical protein VK067_05205 [Pseudogracilibacillus sp.]|nr:hypothetical protein [Pseudogracilibacillus sp.]